MNAKQRYWKSEKYKTGQKRRVKLYQDKKKEDGICRACTKPVSQISKYHCEYHYFYTKYYKTRLSAKKRKIEFDMDCELFIDWMSRQTRTCFYCGCKQEDLASAPEKHQSFSIDRLNNSKGYTLNNICLACWKCNNYKGHFFTSQEWLDIADKYIKPRLLDYHLIKG